MGNYMRFLLVCLILICSIVPSFSQSKSDAFIEEINQIGDQVKLVRQIGGTENIKKVINNIKKFKNTYPSKIVPPVSFTLELYDIQLEDLKKITQALGQCKETDSDAAKRILKSLSSDDGILLVPECTVSEKSVDPELFKLHHHIAAVALKNDLATALLLNKKYLKKPLDNKSVISQVDKLCPKNDSFCTKDMRDWLIDTGVKVLESPDFKASKYRTPKEIADSLADQFSELNYKTLMTSNERKFLNVEVRHDKVQSLYKLATQEYKLNPYGEKYKDLNDKYKAELKSFKYDESALKAYSRYSLPKDSIDYTYNGKNFGLRNTCSGGSESQGLYDQYVDKYTKISGGSDGILLFTDSMKNYRLHVDGWIKSKRCPDLYPVDLSEAQVSRAINESILETERTSSLIRKKYRELQNALSDKEMQVIGVDWVRNFPVAVADAVSAKPERSLAVCSMISELKDRESREHIRDNAIIGGTVIAAGAMLIVPVFGEGAAGATLALGSGAVAGLATAGLNGSKYIDLNSQHEIIVSSIMSGNADLKAHVDDQELRQKAGEAFRSMVLDGAFSTLQVIEFLTQLPKLTVMAGKVDELIKKGKVWKASQVSSKGIASTEKVINNSGALEVSINTAESKQRFLTAEKVLNRKISDSQKKAILVAHTIGSDQGRIIGTYTSVDIIKKARALREAGFSADETRNLMKKGITGVESLEIVGQYSSESLAEVIELIQNPKMSAFPLDYSDKDVRKLASILADVLPHDPLKRREIISNSIKTLNTEFLSMEGQNEIFAYSLLDELNKAGLISSKADDNFNMIKLFSESSNYRSGITVKKLSLAPEKKKEIELLVKLSGNQFPVDNSSMHNKDLLKIISSAMPASPDERAKLVENVFGPVITKEIDYTGDSHLFSNELVRVMVNRGMLDKKDDAGSLLLNKLFE